MLTTYIPISCSFYDRLEAWAVRREKVSICFRDIENNAEQIVEGVIVDLFSKEQVEYLQIETGEKIRLDYLISVNNIPLPPADKSCNT